MSDSTPKTRISNNDNRSGATQVKVAPIPPERYTNGTANGVTSDSVVPPTAGARIPINLNGASQSSDSQTTKMMNTALASVPDVMADDSPPTVEEETVEQQVNHLRPKTLTMQFRFLYTVAFALWLFGTFDFLAGVCC